MAPVKIEPALLKRLVRYDGQSGKLFWLARSEEFFSCQEIQKKRAISTWNARYADREITSLDGVGYITVHINLGERIRIGGHKVAWFLHHGEWPEIVDHINGDKTDNRITNLRSCTPSQNGRNKKISSRNTSGKVGVTFYKRTQKWRAWFSIDGKTVSLGYHDTKHAAIAARVAAEKLHGFCERQQLSEQEFM
jgi:hypothetical protein